MRYLKPLKQLLKLFCLVLVLHSCNLEKDRKLSAQQIAALEKAHNDSVVVIVDALKRTSIYVPPLYDKTYFDSATTVKFFELAKATRGELKLLVNSKLITNEIINILESHAEDNADLLILMDKTGSMADDIANVKEGLGQIVTALNRFNHVRLGIALYGDKNEDGPGWFSFRNFETNYSSAKDFIKQIETTAGGDYPESVYEGFFKACEQQFWKAEKKRMIILIGDAPPLEKPLSMYQVSDLISKAGESSIRMNFYPIVVAPANSDQAEAVMPDNYETEKIISSLYPNPVSAGSINIAFTRNDSYAIEIFNASGVSIVSRQFSGSLWNNDVPGLANGVYMVRVIRKDKKYQTSKFVVYK